LRIAFSAAALTAGRSQPFTDTISKAPLPTVRYQQFKALDFLRKFVTIEPLLDFDLRTFAAWIGSIQPESVYLGFNSRPESVTLPEPSEDKVQRLLDRLLKTGIEIRGKSLPVSPVLALIAFQLLSCRQQITEMTACGASAPVKDGIA
jgi:hypothetical protein